MKKAEYPHIDGALIASIFHDTRSIEAARKTLAVLGARTALGEECALPPHQRQSQHGRNPQSAANSCSEWGGGDWGSDDADLVLIASAMSLEGGGPGEGEREGEGDAELNELRAMFPTMSTYTLRHTLQKCGGDHARVTDELLNRAYLDVDDGVDKGVDGFGVGSGGTVGRSASRGKRRKTKGKNSGNGGGNGGGQGCVPPVDQRRRMSLPTKAPRAASARGASVWDHKNEEIQFLASALGLPRTVVASKHHSTGGPMPRTVVALLNSHDGRQLTEAASASDGAKHAAELEELTREFGGHVTTEHLDRLLRLCGDNKAAVFSLAELLRRNPLEEEDDNMRPANAAPAASRVSSSSFSSSASSHRALTGLLPGCENWTMVRTPLHPPPSPPHPPDSAPASASGGGGGGNGSGAGGYGQLDYSAASQVSREFRLARNEAFQKAAAAYRRSKSDRLMSGAAALYADMGHHYHAKTKEFDNLAAERYVAENSLSDDVLDLHGVTVAQALRIARERTAEWWDCAPPPDARGVRPAPTPLRIVTGLGRHSKGGEAKLAPAVTNMLRRDNWDIRVGKGEIIVYGVRR